MTTFDKISAFNSAITSLPSRFYNILNDISDDFKKRIMEIRFRCNKVVTVTICNNTYFVKPDSTLSEIHTETDLITNRGDIDDIFKTLCDYSVYAYQNEIINGFITIKGGHRAGICGNAVITRGEITNIKDVTSINLRVARQIQGAADYILNQLMLKGPKSLLIVGAPSTGKTTIIRDLARQLSYGNITRYYKVCIVDERKEIASEYHGVIQNDFGPCCDVLSGYPKAFGIEAATRSLSPNVIICDEIGSDSEALVLKGCVNAGIKIIATVHASGKDELLRKTGILPLLKSGVFEKIIFLSNCGTPCIVEKITEAGELFD